jgi:hypothetical protein
MEAVVVVTMDTNILSEAFRTIFTLPPEDIKRVAENLYAHYDSLPKEYVENKVPGTRPNFRFQSYMSITHTELILTEFLKAIFFNNFTDEYNLAGENQATHDSSINITNEFNQIDEKTGQSPRIVVDVQQSGASQQFMADLGAKTTDMIQAENMIIVKKNKSALMTFPINISVISKSKNEANILAGLVQMSLIVNMPILRDRLNINQLTFPTVNAAKPLKQHTSLFMATVSFSINRYVYWSNSFTAKVYENVILRLNALSSENDDNPIVQILAKFNLPLDSRLSDVLKDLERDLS